LKNQNHNSKNPILIVEDDRQIRKLVKFNLEKEGYETLEAKNISDCIKNIKEHPEINVILLDIMLPDGLSHEHLDKIMTSPGFPVIIVLTASSSVEYAVEAMKNGAFDYLQKPYSFEKLFLLIENALEKVQMSNEIIRLRGELLNKNDFNNIIGESEAINILFTNLKKISSSNINVLIRGESGTGKELIAKAIHYNSPRKDQPYVVVNSAAIPDNLIESELFGHEKGSFTGATSRQIGKFEQAHGGTIFLDEIGDMPIKSQVRILRAIQEREITRIGGDEKIDINVRIISATNRNLEELIKAELFREDLYFRLMVFPILVPPLRERKSDIPLLVKHFLDKHMDDSGVKKINLSKGALKAMMDYDWGGNVRELENTILKGLVFMSGNTITAHDLNLKTIEVSKKNNPQSKEKLKTSGSILSEVIPYEESEREILKQAINHFGGNVAKTADHLRIGRATLYRKVKKYNI